MRKLSLTAVMALVLALSAVTLNEPEPVAASPADNYSGTHFGAGNLPPGCEDDVLVGEQMRTGVIATDNACYHMRTGLNALDSPQVDVLIMVPVSPTAERDMRIMRQSVEMWEGGIDYLAEQMGLQWLTDGMDFHITVDYFDPLGDGGGEFTTYPIVDPEIVVLAYNPVPFAHAGIGIDPFADTPQNRCNAFPVGNPLDFEQWEALPGFDSHHQDRPTGTYVEDCSANGGGNVCYAINAGGDPPVLDVLSLFDLVAHEFGHCLTVGHVGDGLEGKWGKLPSNDIMAYSQDPPGLSKCVSTLDVEGVALRMSRYLDVNGDGAINDGDRLWANDQVGQGANHFQVQHPDDHLYASGTGLVTDCPQPDTGVVAGERVDWTPEPVTTHERVLTITSPEDGAISDSGVFNVTGTVENVELGPTEPTGSVDDADDDATSSVTEITSVGIEVTDTHVVAEISLADLWPIAAGASGTSYSVTIDGRTFDSFIYGTSTSPRTWDNGGGYCDTTTTAWPVLPEQRCSSSWDASTKTVTLRINRAYLQDKAGIASPYFVSSSANFGGVGSTSVDDRAPDGTGTVGVAGSVATVGVGLPALPGTEQAGTTVTFEHDGPYKNTFYPENSTLGVTEQVGVDPSHLFPLEVPETSDIEFRLDWTDAVGGADLDLYVTGAANSANLGAGITRPETFTLTDVKGLLNLKVTPYFVTDPLEGSTYTLTATITPKVIDPIDTDLDGIFDGADACPTVPGIAPSGCPDSDGDGVIDIDDVCPEVAGSGADGCPILATERVTLWVGGAIAATQDVDTVNGPDTFVLPVALAEGTHEVRVDWERKGKVVDSEFITLTHNTDDDGDGVSNDSDRCPGFDDLADQDRDGIADGCDPDRDGDGLTDPADNCDAKANADQADLDRDGIGDVCDDDIDGDGHSNGKEKAHGTDPRNASSYPAKPRAAGVNL
jgi:hypothetical protein